MAPHSTQPDSSIIALDKFILATRDSGYKGTASAIAELVDNALQARAKEISITVRTVEAADGAADIEVSVLDDGSGMDPFTLRQALRFGGSSRFNDRSGLGRYGMGLPNSSLSQARRVTVYTWQSRGQVYSSYLDVDEIATGEMVEVPSPRRAPLPRECESDTGTLVIWSRCDRLDNRRASTIVRKLADALGQTFRFFLWNGTRIGINDVPVKPFDPLFLRREAGKPAAEVFGEPIEYEVSVSPTGGKTAGLVKVTFTELPLHDWHNLSNDAKRELGISKGGGVSVVRAGREVDYGWFFMGNKRRENYDDWFRCQIEFDPALDEAFGITHTKQQIHPQQYLTDALAPDLEAAAHALNARIRKAHAMLAAAERAADAERVATRKDHLLRPIPGRAVEATSELAGILRKKHPALRQRSDALPQDSSLYKLVEHNLKGSTDFFTHAWVDGRLVVVLNQSHPFFKKVYKPLADSEQPKDKALRSQLELLLMAAARSAAAMGTGKAADDLLTRFRKEWSDTLAAFLND